MACHGPRPHWIILFLFSFSGPAAATDIVTDIISKCVNATGPENDCSIAGDGDLYGEGVRYGIYLGWIASWIGNNFLRNEAELCQTLDTNSMFLTAVAINVTWFTLSNKIRVIDALILLQLCFGYLLSVMSLWGYRTRVYADDKPRNRQHFGGWGTHFRLLLMCAICAYGIWFWSWGMPLYLPRCNLRQQCGGLKIWILVACEVANPGIQLLFLAFSSICEAFYFSMILIAAAATLKFLWKIPCGKRTGCARFEWRLRREIEKAEPWPLNLPRRIRYPVLLLNALWIAFSMASIEQTLNLNHVTGNHVVSLIASAGQFIPLIVGGCNLGRVVYKCLLQNIFPDAPQPEASRTSSSSSSSSSSRSRARVHHERVWWWTAVTTVWPWLCAFKPWRDTGIKGSKRRDTSSRYYGSSSSSGDGGRVHV